MCRDFLPCHCVETVDNVETVNYVEILDCVDIVIV